MVSCKLPSIRSQNQVSLVRHRTSAKCGAPAPFNVQVRGLACCTLQQKNPSPQRPAQKKKNKHRLKLGLKSRQLQASAAGVSHSKVTPEEANSSRPLASQWAARSGPWTPSSATGDATGDPGVISAPRPWWDLSLGVEKWKPKRTTKDVVHIFGARVFFVIILLLLLLLL